jgi:hypothetical protein
LLHFREPLLLQNLKGPSRHTGLYLLSDFAEAVLLSPSHDPFQII